MKSKTENSNPFAMGAMFTAVEWVLVVGRNLGPISFPRSHYPPKQSV
jgi:hypothetical protein